MKGISSACFLFVLVCALARTPLSAADVPAPLSQKDEVFDIRVDYTMYQQSDAATFAFVQKAFVRDPRPHVKARYAELVIGGKASGAPEGMAAEGIALAQAALDEGSLHAMRVIGWELATGRYMTADPARAQTLLTTAANAQNSNAMVTLGDAFLRGLFTGQSQAAPAEIWFRRAAILGKPHSLFRLGSAFEDGGPANLTKACQLYYEAAIYGSNNAQRRLKELAAKGDATAARSYYLVVLWHAALGSDFQTKQVKEAVRALEPTYPEDSLVLVTLGRMYRSGEFGYRDMKHAYALFDKAAQLGSDDGRSERAVMLAEGYGVEKDEKKAVDEWRALEARGNGRALAQLGFYRYWGSLKTAALAKDATLAFRYSKRAADLGDVFGQKNVAACYESGIGVEKNYALAARYYRAAGWRGWRYSEKQMHKLLDHVDG